MLQQAIGEWENDNNLDDIEYDIDENGCGGFLPTLTGMVLRSFERSINYQKCWKNILQICENLDLPPPQIQSSTSPDPRIRVLDNLGLRGYLPYNQRPWISDIYQCNTDLLYRALPRLMNWPNELSRDEVDDEWKELEVCSEINELEKLEELLHPRFSIVDGLPCCRNGCTDEPYECQQCPLCDERVPAYELKLKDQILKNGQWVGPHCVSCDYELFLKGI